MDIISKALEVAEDYPVFPCDVKKRPVCQGGFKAATQDPDEIERLFSASNAALIGIPTGEASGVSVIDIDVRDGKQGKEWVVKNAELLGITKVAETQSGGWHYYYCHSDGIRNRAGIDGCVDVRGDGGYVIHPESTGYRWVNDEDFAEFPPRVAAQSTGVASASLDVPMGSDAFDTFGQRVDGREHYMAAVVLAAISDFYRNNGTFPTMQWMENEVYPTYERKVKSRTGDLNAEGRGIDEFRKKVTSTIIRAREGKIADIHIALSPSSFGLDSFIWHLLSPRRCLRTLKRLSKVLIKVASAYLVRVLIEVKALWDTRLRLKHIHNLETLCLASTLWLHDGLLTAAQCGFVCSAIIQQATRCLCTRYLTS